MAIDIKAELNYFPVSSQKMRLVIDLVRGKKAEEALTTLRFVNKKSAEPVRKLIASAMANGEHNFGVPAENLYIHEIVANEAPTRKWRRYGARGRFKPILRRSTHVKVILREKV
jgi:large subunit ribosomal protein L22